MREVAFKPNGSLFQHLRIVIITSLRFFFCRPLCIDEFKPSIKVYDVSCRLHLKESLLLMSEQGAQ